MPEAAKAAKARKAKAEQLDVDKVKDMRLLRLNLSLLEHGFAVCVVLVFEEIPRSVFIVFVDDV